ncbi:MAG: DNA mismatch repair endonuclease MutL [Alistipes sp.]|nr:DNA mismatch repair endonuclease MutL [Alistipes sp.]MBO7264071.1 DNA mismatch repair endonuclease MutL [Alistipes sp.]
MSSNTIMLLPEIVANQIAAGEVVNGPANVVKEMMENSLDAGATSVSVNYRNGGKDLIQIIDNGKGMSNVDARMAFDRHATSKIRSIEDVYALHTFGFRGEALASIAAVAEVELRTRREEDELGTLTEISGGTFRSQKPISCSKGSQFMVRNLFYNVPSRRKFIDGDNSRLSSQIKSEFMRVALCYPEVEFELRQNDAPVYSLQPTNRKGRIIDVVGKHIKQNLLDVEVDTSVVRIEGFVGRPQASKKRNNEQYLFVNGRYFNSVAMQRAIVRAYEKLIPEGCMPSYFIYITVNPDMVDVNVHPQKTTVKFADHDLIIEILQAAVRETLAKTGAVPMMDFSDERRIDIPVLGHTSSRGVYSEPRTATKSSYNPFDSEYIDPTAPMPDTPFTGFDVPYDGFMPRESAKDVAPIARDNELYSYPSAGGMESVMEYIDEDEAEEQTFDFIESAGLCAERREFGEVMYVGSGYAVAIYGGAVVLVSLRRAKERLLYEDIVRSLGAGAVPVQRMFFAEELILSLEEYELLENYATEFAALGFEIEYRGDGAISVSGRPAVIDMATPIDELLYELLHSLDMGETLGERERCRMAELMAQRGSHNYGGGLNSASAGELLRRLAECDNTNFTPSGCPIMAELTLDEIKAKLTK